jgi:hypothetical protein
MQALTVHPLPSRWKLQEVRGCPHLKKQTRSHSSYVLRMTAHHDMHKQVARSGPLYAEVERKRVHAARASIPQ